MKNLCSSHRWANSEWIKTIDYAYVRLDITNYKMRCPLVLTHGDPHLENIFHYERQIWFIDWEWASLGSPLRDITILMQDMYDLDLIQFIFNLYWTFLEESKLDVNKMDYRKDFNLLYIDHTTMMLAWEIEKYLQGYTTEDKIKEITEFKISEIKRATNEDLNLQM